MTKNLVDQLCAISPRELEMLRTLKAMGAASADELAVKLSRAGEDLRSEIEDLVRRKLLQVKTVECEDEKLNIYLAAREIRPLL